jgi:BTB/POZ domain
MPNADVILQSANMVKFRVHKVVLVTSSPFFDSMFSLPQPPNDETVDGLPSVPVSEDAETLNSLISLLYPVSPEIPDADDNILALIAASQKYEMVAVQSLIRAEVSRRGLLSPEGIEAFRVYAVAYRQRLLPEVTTTAYLTLDHSMTFDYLGEALRSFEGRALHDLLNFRQCCSTHLETCRNLFLDHANGPSRIWAGSSYPVPSFCSSQPENNLGSLPTWLKNLLGSPDIPTLKPSRFRGEYLKALQGHLNKRDCHFCMKVHALQGEAFCEEIEKALMQARNVQYTFFEGIL